MEKFHNTYRIDSARAPWWDYSWQGKYLVTVCTADHECLFGNIVDRQGRVSLQVSSIGEIVLQEWNKSFDIRRELFCDAFVLMPNRLHAVLRIDYGMGYSNENGVSHVLDNLDVETHGRASLHLNCPERNSHENELDPIIQGFANTGVAYRSPKSISSFMAGFKSSATKLINQYRKTPGTRVWQSRFHDRIIRDELELERIVTYIENNPKNWKRDEFYKL